MANTNILEQLTDDGLILEAKRLAADERTVSAALIRALIELDTRKLYRREGCPSLFTYCTQVLHLAEGAAYNRIEAARSARQFPQVLEALTSGAVNLTTVRLLAPHLTTANADALLADARYKTKREVEVLVATLHPKPAAASVIRKLPTVQPSAASAAPFTAASSTGGTMDDNAAITSSPQASQPSRRNEPSAPIAVPLAPDRYKVQFTVTGATHDKLRRAQDLLRHAIPSGDPAEIFDRALTLLIEDIERRKLASVSKPRKISPSFVPKGRHIPAAVRRAVWIRDEGRCAFIGREGRCLETGFLELHHVQPYAEGGAATTENIELRCRAHNAYESRLFFGEDYVRERANSFWNELAVLGEQLDAR